MVALTRNFRPFSTVGTVTHLAVQMSNMPRVRRKKKERQLLGLKWN